MNAPENNCGGPSAVVDYSVGDLINALAHNLSELRDSRGWSIRLAAKKLGVAESTWSQWESGKRFPSPECLKIIGILFDVCPAMLIVDCGNCQRDCAHKPSGVIRTKNKTPELASGVLRENNVC